MANGNAEKIPSEEEMQLAAHLANKQTIRINDAHDFTETVTGKISDQTSQDLELKFDPYPEQLHIITHVAAKEDTNQGTRIELYKITAAQEHLLNSDKPSAASHAVTWNSEMLIATPHKIRAKFVGGTTDDAIMLTVIGYWIPRKP